MFGALTGGVPADQAFDRAKAAVGDLYGQAKAVVGDLVDSLSPEQIEAVAKATPEQQQEIQENVKSSSTQGFSQPDIFGFSPTTTPESVTLENGVTVTPMSNGMNEITMPDGRKTTQNPDGTINSFSSYALRGN
jgi:hypothetical protein